MRFLIVCLLALMPVTTQAQQLLRAQTPDWVELADIPEMPQDLRAQAARGLHYLMVDTQISWREEVELAYYRRVTEVADRARLEEAATINIPFDPEFDVVHLLHLDVVRDGQRIPYADQLQAQIFRREQRLETGIIDGTLTAYLQLPDLRVGDVVDYAILTENTAVVPGANRARIASMEYSVPTAVVRKILHWPNDWPFHSVTLPDRVAYSATPGTTTTRHEWLRVNHLPELIENDTPNEALPFADAQYSSWSDWGALSALLTPYYTSDHPLPTEWAAKVDAIAAESDDPAIRTIAALRLVQDQIRYVGLEVGTGGYYARLPEVVATKGFGDCKDKALLLRVTLARLGVEADVALTDLDNGYGLPNRLPSLYAFDHMILRARVGGKTYYMDPTASHEAGDLIHAVQPDYGYALPLTGPDRTALERIEVDPKHAWRIDTVEAFGFTPFGVHLGVTTTYHGSAANWFRQRRANEPLTMIGTEMLNYYNATYPGVQTVSPIAVEDQPDQNTTVLSENYMITLPDMIRNGLQEAFPFAPDGFNRLMPKAQAGLRRAPMLIGGPSDMRHRVEVRNAPIDFATPDNVRLSNEAFTYTFDGQVKEIGSMTLDWRFAAKSRTVSAEGAETALRDAREMGQSTYYDWNLTP